MAGTQHCHWHNLVAASLLAAALCSLPISVFAGSTEDEPSSGFGEQIDQLKAQAEALEKESKIEADDEHYEEAHELLLTVKGLLAERENLLKDGGRKASSNEALSRFSRELEENTKWRKNNKEMINLLRLAL